MQSALERNCCTQFVDVGRNFGKITGDNHARSLMQRFRTISRNDSDSDPGFSGDSSGDSPRGTKRSPETRYSYGGSKRARQDFTPLTNGHHDETMEDGDCFVSSQGSIKSSQLSFMDDLNNSQPVCSANGMAVYCDQTTSENEDMQSSQPPIIEDMYPVMHAKRNSAKYSKGVTKDKQSELLSSQESVNSQAETSKQDTQKAKNRMYARGSRERKMQKISSLEETNMHLKSVTEIYKKAITVYYMKLRGGQMPTWTQHNIPWYNSTGGEYEECQVVKCLLPVEDESFLDELGNNPYGKIIANNSAMSFGYQSLPANIAMRNSGVIKISNSGSVSTYNNIQNSAILSSKISLSTTSPSLLHTGTGYNQNPPAKVDLTDSGDDGLIRSEDLLPFDTPIAVVKPELREDIGQAGLSSRHKASSNTPNFPDDTDSLMTTPQINYGMTNPSYATTATETTSVSKTTANIIATSNGKRTQQCSRFGTTFKIFKPELNGVPATVNVTAVPSCRNIEATQKYFNSTGPNVSGLHTFYVEPDVIYVDTAENELTLGQTSTFLESSPRHTAAYTSSKKEEVIQPVNLTRGSSVESLCQEILEVEDLEPSLETASPQ